MKRILIVDDSSVMRKNLRLILSREGYDVVAEASNGEEARRAYHTYLPDLVTMDITMPVMNGIDAVKAITKEDPDARIIVISAFDQRTMLFEAMENGARHYIIKPITAEKLLQAVRQVLEAAAAVEPAEASPRSPETVPEAEAAFTVENSNGTFILNMPGPDCGPHLPKAQQALQGLLFIRPLSVEFRLSGAKDTDPGNLDRLAGMVRHVREAGGQAVLSADRLELADTVRNRFPDITVMEYRQE